MLDERGRDLSIPQCWALLRTTSMGSLALSVRALPMIIPVQYHLLDHVIAICLETAPHLGRSVEGTVAAFAASSVDPGPGDGWAVHVVGTLDRRLPAKQEWCPDADASVVYLEPVEIKGWPMRLCPFIDWHRSAQ